MKQSEKFAAVLAHLEEHAPPLAEMLKVVSNEDESMISDREYEPFFNILIWYVNYHVQPFPPAFFQ